MNDFEMTMEIAEKMAKENIAGFLTAEFGMRLVADWEDPEQAYLQEQNTFSQAGEVFSVPVWGIGNMDDMDYYRKDWDCSKLTDEEVLLECCKNGDVDDEIRQLAEDIFTCARQWAEDKNNAAENAAQIDAEGT